MIMIGIYKWTNKINNKAYIGQSIDIENRSKKHIAAAFYPKSNTYNTAFHQALRKYSPEQFDFEILCICKKEELNDLEQYYIKKFNTLVPNGYNMTTGGENPWSCHNRYTRENIKAIIEELRNTDDTATEIGRRWGCSDSLIKKICAGDEYKIEEEIYPIRDAQHIQRVKNKKNPLCQCINPAAQLSLSIVEDIVYDLLETDISIRDLAQKYKISIDQISRINMGKAWQQVQRPIPCRDTRKQNEQKALLVADLLLNTSFSQVEILKLTGYKDRHTIQKINKHQIYTDLLKFYPNPIRN